jgi:hypothetical protein
MALRAQGSARVDVVSSATHTFRSDHDSEESSNEPKRGGRGVVFGEDVEGIDEDLDARAECLA